MGNQKCQMIMLSVWERGKALPTAKAIVISSDREKARKYAEKELEPYISGQNPSSREYMFTQKDLGGILLWPIPTTVFLYVRGERIK